MKCPQGHEVVKKAMPLGGPGVECYRCGEHWTAQQFRQLRSGRIKHHPDKPDPQPPRRGKAKSKAAQAVFERSNDGE